jgi:hypothetical protein
MYILEKGYVITAPLRLSMLNFNYPVLIRVSGPLAIAFIAESL